MIFDVSVQVADLHSHSHRSTLLISPQHCTDLYTATCSTCSYEKRHGSIKGWKRMFGKCNSELISTCFARHLPNAP
jgi:hypothetical protein